MSHSIKGNQISPLNDDVIVACATCGGSGSVGGPKTKKSRYSRDEQTAPAVPPKVIFTPIPQRPQRDEIAAHGSFDPNKLGHLMGADVKFTEERAKEVLERLPEDQQLGREPTGPCAYEVSQFIMCADRTENLQDCEMIEKDLQKCKEKHKLPSRTP